MDSLEIINITKEYKKKKALDNVSCTFSKGVNTLLGANGAGKSTLMGIISTALSPTLGEVKYGGKEIISMGEEYRSRIALLFQHQPYFPSSKVSEYMRYNAQLKGIPDAKITELSQKALEKFGVADCINMKLKELSGGLRQRVFLAQTVISEPEIIILDEPSAGLDIAERSELKEIMRQLGDNAILIISTHIVSDIEGITDNIFVIDKGKLLCSGSVSEIPDGNISSFYLRITGGEK